MSIKDGKIVIESNPVVELPLVVFSFVSLHSSILLSRSLLVGRENPCPNDRLWTTITGKVTLCRVAF